MQPIIHHNKLLYYQEFGSGPTLIFIHGLFGSSDNFRTIAKKLSNYRCILVDQRNHGNSFHSKSINYTLMAHDLALLLQKLNIEKTIIIGHSLGGKTAIMFTLLFPEKVSQLIVVDMPPTSIEPTHESIFESILKLDLSLYKTRQECDMALKKNIPNNQLRLFLLKNISPEKNHLSWKCNFKYLRENYHALCEAIPLPKEIKTKTFFLKGGLSNYINIKNESLIKHHFKNLTIDSIQNAGHWPHASHPDEFTNKLLTFINN